MKTWVIAALAYISSWAPVEQLDAKEVTCLAQAIYHEARGEPLAGQLLVAEVVLNRVDHSAFPKTICKVAAQRRQFPWWSGRARISVEERGRFYYATEIAALMMSGYIDRQHPDLLYFHARKGALTGWTKGLVRQQWVGEHIFLAEANN